MWNCNKALQHKILKNSAWQLLRFTVYLCVYLCVCVRVCFSTLGCHHSRSQASYRKQIIVQQ